jgi:arylformamidase
MRFTRLVDLSHAITPEEGSRPVNIEMVPPPEHDGFPDDQWYVMHKLAFLNHVGTHIEVPYHVIEDGDDLSEVPLESLCGEAVILDLVGAEPGEYMPLSMIQEAAEKAGGIQDGDIVFCRFDYDKWYDDDDGPSWPRFSAESIEWLIEQGMKLMGTDLGGIELGGDDARSDQQYNHHLILDRGIPLIENVAHMDQLSKSRVTVFCFPVGIRKMDSFPLRVVAAED